jgi:primosomal protein N' (replication factor Y)
MRAQRAVCPVVLASATPSIESFHHATTGRYQLLELRDRPGGRALPAVTLLDVRAEDTRGRRGLCAPSLETAIVDTAARGGQSLLFLNRRGFAHFVHCLSCGEPVTCGECSVTLTLHRERRALVCHHCGFVRPLNLACPGCGTPAVEGRAPGTEQVETLLRRRFPALRIARMDRDSTVRRGAHSRLLTTWHRGEVDVMVGTQMVTKGIDNPRVMLVGVLNADISLNQPDFRAGERTFQLVTQVAGRAGRGDAAGRVIVQTLRPDHYSLRAAMAHDYRALFAEEIASRQALGYPPFRRLINVRAEARDPTTAERVARDLAATIRGGGGAATARIDVLGPAPSPIERLRGWNRWQLLVRGTDRPAMRAAVARGLATIDAQRRATVRIVVDVDPISML